jgi:hypothetical protein
MITSSALRAMLAEYSGVTSPLLSEIETHSSMIEYITNEWQFVTRQYVVSNLAKFEKETNLLDWEVLAHKERTNSWCKSFLGYKGSSSPGLVFC